MLKDQLRVAGNPCREVCWQCNRLIKGIGVQGLRATQAQRSSLQMPCAPHCCTGPVPAETHLMSDNGFSVSGCVPSHQIPVIILAQSIRAARSFAASMKKFMPMAKKNESRPANCSTSMPLGYALHAHIRVRLPAYRQAPAPASHLPPACDSRKLKSN